MEREDAQTVNHDMNIAAEIFRMEEKIGMAFDMTKLAIQKIAPRPIHSVQVKALWTLTCSGFVMRIIVMYCTYVSSVFF
jgi:hypothetical protein